MKQFLFPTLLIALFFLSSCAKKVTVSYQLESENTGAVVLKPAKPTERTYITINDNLIVDKKRVKSVTIENLPDGKYDIHYTSDNSWYKEKLDSHVEVTMQNGKQITKLVEVPPYSSGYWIYTGAMAGVSLVLLFTLGSL